MDDLTEEKQTLISVESTTEWQIYNILYDGQERYLQPLKFSDHVAKLAHKVDWQKLCGNERGNSAAVISSTKSVEEEGKDREDSSTKELSVTEEKDKSTKSTSVGPWDSVAQGLKRSLDEINVLHDLLVMIKARRNIGIARVSVDAAAAGDTSLRQATFISKKKAVGNAGLVLQTVTDKLKAELKSSDGNKQVVTFQSELIRMRKRWRLKKTGTYVLGDLAYRSTGSRFRPEATFELQKRATEAEGGPKGQKCPVKVILPKDLEDFATLKIVIAKRGKAIAECAPWLLPEKPGRGSEAAASLRPWEPRLIKAQRTLLCRDIFAQLCSEASQLPHLATIVKSSGISVHMPNGYVLCFSLEKLASHPSSSDKQVKPGGHIPPLAAGSTFSLYDAMFHLFCKEYSGVASTTPELCPPYSAPTVSGVPKRLRLAGPCGASVSDLSHATAPRVDRTLPLLSKLVDRAKHFIIVKRLEEALDKYVEGVSNVLIYYRWISDPVCAYLQTNLSIHIQAPGYEHAYRHSYSSLVVEVSGAQFRIVNRDGDSCTVSENPQELLDLLDVMTANHQLVVLHNIVSRLGEWHILSCQLFNCRPDDSKLCPTMIIGNRSATRMISIAYPVGEEPNVQVQIDEYSSNSIKNEPESLNDDSELILASYLTDLRQEYRPVIYAELPGCNFVQKMEFLMIALS